jgi:GPI inositol-deacylase
VLPALFVPGNAGSYVQVRPLASETARAWAAARRGQRLAGLLPDLLVPSPAGGGGGGDVYVQWYSVDTREELPAFDGDLLVRICS